MPRVAIVTDSSCDLPLPLRDAAGVEAVPLDITIGERRFTDGADLTGAGLIRAMAESADAPVVSGPSAAAWQARFAALADTHDEAVALCCSGKLSDGLAGARSAAEAVRDRVAVEVVDSRSATMGLGLQVLRAVGLAREGLDAASVADRLRAETERYPVLLSVDTLEHLRRGGHVGRSAAMIGDLLQLKPLLWLDEGQFVPLERTRTRHRAVAGLVEFVAELPRPERVAVLHSSDERQAVDLADRIAAATGIDREAMLVARMGPLIVAQTGPGALGVAVREGS